MYVNRNNGFLIQIFLLRTVLHIQLYNIMLYSQLQIVNKKSKDFVWTTCVVAARGIPAKHVTEAPILKMVMAEE